MRPHFKVLDKTFNTRAADRTPLVKERRASLRDMEVRSEKVYEFKKPVLEEEFEIEEQCQVDTSTTVSTGYIRIFYGSQILYEGTMGATY